MLVGTLPVVGLPDRHGQREGQIHLTVLQPVDVLNRASGHLRRVLAQGVTEREPARERPADRVVDPPGPGRAEAHELDPAATVAAAGEAGDHHAQAENRPGANPKAHPSRFFRRS